MYLIIYYHLEFIIIITATIIIIITIIIVVPIAINLPNLHLIVKLLKSFSFIIIS